MEKRNDIQKILISEEQLAAKVAELGAAISRDYEGKKLMILGVLKGSVVFMADLLRHITIPVEMDFMAVSSYGAGVKTTGVVKILKDLDRLIEGYHVLVVEDILDSGMTLSYLTELLRDRGPASVRIATLLDKPQGGHRPGLCGLHRSGRIRGGLRPGLRRAIPQSSLCRYPGTPCVRKISEFAHNIRYTQPGPGASRPERQECFLL